MCGALGRKDNLQKWHLPNCQPDIPEGESGFLKLGERPQRNSEDVEMVLRIIGAPNLPPDENKVANRDDASTVSESCGEEGLQAVASTKMATPPLAAQLADPGSARTGADGLVQEPEEVYAMDTQSLVSFGKPAALSKTHRQAESPKHSLQNKNVLKIVHRVVDCRPKGPILVQDDIDSFYSAIKRGVYPGKKTPLDE